VLGAALAVVGCSTGASGASGARSPGRVSVDAPSPTSVQSKVRIGFDAVQLPGGGYYYAVLVLDRYAGHSPRHPPPCAISSNMRMTEYGHPHRGRVHLTLGPAGSQAGHWCAGATYLGAVYAVPHRPPCSSYYPCYGRSTGSGGCWELEGGHTVCGVVAIPEYSYPGGLPRPSDPSIRAIGHFKVHFPG